MWSAGNIWDTAAPVGPYLADRTEIADPHVLDLKTLGNGTLMQNGSTRNFIYDVRYIVGYLSGLMGRSPGDLIATGTPAGVGHGMKPPVYLNPGDVWSIGGIKAQLTEPPFSAPTPPSRRRSSPGTARTTSVSRDSLREQ